MILIEEQPKNSTVSKYVDRYQFFRFDKSGFFKTVPNGKIELYIVKSGGFKIWMDDENSFRPSEHSGFIPATSKLAFYEIPEQLVCLNIKFNLNVLALPFFEGFLPEWRSRKVENLIPEKAIRKIRSLVKVNLTELSIEKLDEVLSEALEDECLNQDVVQVIEWMGDYAHKDFRVTALAELMNMSPKTLERFTKKHFNLTPKNLWQIIRFEQTTSHIKNLSTQKLIDSLAFGFYDQSHFIKECKKITGYPPREFFSKLKLSTNDLIFDSEKLE